VGFLSKYDRECVSLSLGLVGISQLVFGLIPMRVYSSESFAQFSTYQLLLIGVSILVSAPTYSLLLASRFNAENDEMTFRSIRNWLATTFLLLLVFTILVGLLFGNSKIYLVAILLFFAFFGSFESAVLRSRLAFDEQWVHISILFSAEAALRFVLVSIHFLIGTPVPLILIAENICLQLVTILVANQLLGRDGWGLVSPFSKAIFLRYSLLLLATLSTLILNTFIAPIAQLFNLENPREISLAIYLLIFSRIPSTILFPIIQPEIQRLILLKDYKLNVSKIFVVPLILILGYFLLIFISAWRFIDVTGIFSDYPFLLTFVMNISLAVLFTLETSVAFYLVNTDRLVTLVKLYFASILVILTLVSHVTSAIGLIILAIASEIAFLVVFVIGLQFSKKFPS
jgi:hypothetical protein